ncbi:hypothetical protein C8T65DRAFT_742652 [Cerioporus squamosus]|nr:hypothetical protein C8T65DRAFT_742652 [Cerioporus squamosus]
MPDLTEIHRQAKERYGVVNDRYLDDWGVEPPRKQAMNEVDPSHGFLGIAYVGPPSLPRGPKKKKLTGTKSQRDAQTAVHVTEIPSRTQTQLMWLRGLGRNNADNARSGPLEILDAPARIYNKAFADFLLDMKASHEKLSFTPEELALASHVAAATSATYSSEQQRTEVVYNLLMTIVQPEVDKDTRCVRLCPAGTRIVGESKRDRFLAFSPAKPDVSEHSD